MKIKCGTFSNTSWYKMLMITVIIMSLTTNIVQYKAISDQREVNEQLALDNADLFEIINGSQQYVQGYSMLCEKLGLSPKEADTLLDALTTNK